MTQVKQIRVQMYDSTREITWRTANIWETYDLVHLLQLSALYFVEILQMKSLLPPTAIFEQRGTVVVYVGTL